jgi:hypothetical protein
MQITFPGPDGQPLTVVDSRRAQGPGGRDKAVAVTLPAARRPAGWIIATMRV